MLRNEKFDMVNFIISRQNDILHELLKLLHSNETMSFLSLCREMLNIKNIFMDSLEINNIKLITIIKKRYEKIQVNNLFLNYNFNVRDCEFLKSFVNIKSLFLTNRVLLMNKVLDNVKKNIITDITFTGNMNFSNSTSKKKTDMLYEVVNKFISGSSIKNIYFKANSIFNNYNNFSMTNITKASFYCNTIIENIPTMDNIVFLEISSHLITHLTNNQILPLFLQKFKKLKILHIIGEAGENYDIFINKIKNLLVLSIYKIKLTDCHGNVIISYINYSKMESSKDIGRLMSEIIFKKYLKFLIIIIDKKLVYSTSHSLHMLFYFSITRKLNLICKEKGNNKILTAKLINTEYLNYNFHDLS